MKAVAGELPLVSRAAWNAALPDGTRLLTLWDGRDALRPRRGELIMPEEQEPVRTLEAALLKADARRDDLEIICALAREGRFHGVWVHSSRVAQAAHWLEEDGVKTICVIASPHGAMDGDVKRYELEAAIDSGAQEFETALNVGFLKDGEDARVLRELRDLVQAAEERPLGIILETLLLSGDEMARAVDLVSEAGAQFVTLGGATAGQVRALREILTPRVRIKVFGNIAGQEAIAELTGAGAARVVLFAHQLVAAGGR
jgi:deoxyribose-phosphate aldolase